MKRTWWNCESSWQNNGVCYVITAGFQFGHLGDLDNQEIFGGGPPVATFYLLQEDGASRIILEDGTGFLELEH